jgi:hypothetical protein
MQNSTEKKLLFEKISDIKLTSISLGFGQIKTTVYSDEDDAHKQQFSTNGNLLIAVSTLVNETYSPPRNLIKSFFRSKFPKQINRQFSRIY